MTGNRAAEIQDVRRHTRREALASEHWRRLRTQCLGLSVLDAIQIVEPIAISSRTKEVDFLTLSR